MSNTPITGTRLLFVSKISATSNNAYIFEDRADFDRWCTRYGFSEADGILAPWNH